MKQRQQPQPAARPRADMQPAADIAGRGHIATDRVPPSVKQRQLIAGVAASPRMGAQRAAIDAVHQSPALAAQRNTPVQGRNGGGLPPQLKTGIENLSGVAMHDVKVHYNSSKPAQLQALAFAQGTNIHVGPGQERHLPHEAWHVVQQKQGRVKPTMQAKTAAINDDPRLEREADVMGARAGMAGSVQLQRSLGHVFGGGGGDVAQLMIHAPADISALGNYIELGQLIADYNRTYDQRFLDTLVDRLEAHSVVGSAAARGQLKALIAAVDKEIGNRHVVTHVVRIPADVSDAKHYQSSNSSDSMTENCAFTSVAAVLGGGAQASRAAVDGQNFQGLLPSSVDDSDDGGAPVGDDLVRDDNFDLYADQEKADAKVASEVKAVPHDRLSTQINQVVEYVAGQFRAAGFTADVHGKRDYYQFAPVAQTIPVMRAYPTGTQFLVYLQRTTRNIGVEPDEVGDFAADSDVLAVLDSKKKLLGAGSDFAAGLGHWVYADRYGDQIFFYDYQAGRVAQHIADAKSAVPAPTFEPLLPTYPAPDKKTGHLAADSKITLSPAVNMVFVAIKTTMRNRTRMQAKSATIAD